MSTHRTSLPFNKDYASVRQLKDAAEALELLFDTIERYDSSDMNLGESERRLAGLVHSIYENWLQKYPKKD